MADWPQAARSTVREEETMTVRPRHSDLAQRLRALAYHWREAGFPTDAATYDLAADEIEKLWTETGREVPTENVVGPRARVQQASAKMEAFYHDALMSIAKIAREKYGDEPKVLHMIAGLSKAVGMMICACYPNERDLARETAIVNMDDAVKRYAAGEPSPMSLQ